MKSYIVTGATSGMGEACLRKLVGEGAFVIAVGRNREKLSELKREFSDNVETVNYDLDNLDDIESIFEVCKKQEIKLDGMIYCAGMDELRPVKSINVDSMQKLMRVNCFSFVKMCKCFYSKRYSKDGASIVAISSISSKLCDVGMISYSMSKAALNAAVKTMAKEFMGRKIRVNAILPGGVATKMSEEKGQLLSNIKMNKEIQGLGLIPVEDMTEIICEMLDDKTKYMTGELISVSGGIDYSL